MPPRRLSIGGHAGAAARNRGAAVSPAARRKFLQPAFRPSRHRDQSEPSSTNRDRATLNRQLAGYWPLASRLGPTMYGAGSSEVGRMRAGVGWRGGWTAAIVIALVAALLAAPRIPAGGIDGRADYRAVYSACVGPATASAGFEDMVGSFAESAADCLAYYGITKGTSAGRFSPTDVVTRRQMALFLIRAAPPAGIVVPKAVDQGFTDIGGLSRPDRNAINQLAALGITKGVSPSAFAPDRPVTRRQMALFLSRFLQEAPPGPGATPIVDVRPDDRTFRDLSRLSHTDHEAIRKLFEMGVIAGTSAHTFSPHDPVSRSQMAVFLSRTLHHTNARPVGLSVQTASTHVFKNSVLTLSISVRDVHHVPVEGAFVDIFTALDPAEALKRDGTCSNKVAFVHGGPTCEIDPSDWSADAAGNLAATVRIASEDRLRIWIWTGELEAVFDADTAKFETIDVTTPKEAVALEVSDDLAAGARKVRYGELVTFRFRLVDRDGGTVARSGVGFRILIAESHTGAPGIVRTTITKETDAGGRAELTHRYVDPTGDPGDVSRLDLDVQATGKLRVDDATTILMVQNDGDSVNDPLLEWTDGRSTPTNLEITLTNPYQRASDAGEGAANTVLAKLVDQYGAPAVGEPVVFTSNDPAGVPHGTRTVTGPGGLARLNYQRDSAISGVETISVRFEQLSRAIRQYWVTPASVGEKASGSVLAIQSAERTIIVTVGNRIALIKYDDGDRFTLGCRTVSLSDFERFLDVRDTLAYQITGTTEAAVNLFDLDCK